MGVVESIEQYEHLGGEFLVWLWWLSERDEGKIDLELCDDLTLHLGDSMLLEGYTGNAEKVMLKGDIPSQSPESRAALYENKLPRKIQLLFQIDGADWKVTVDSKTLALSGLKIPVPSGLFYDEAVAMRLEMVERFTAVFYGLFEKFLSERLDAPSWGNNTNSIKTWIAN